VNNQQGCSNGDNPLRRGSLPERKHKNDNAENNLTDFAVAHNTPPILLSNAGLIKLPTLLAFRSHTAQFSNPK